MNMRTVACLPASMQSPLHYLPPALLPLLAQAVRFGAHSGLIRLFDNDLNGPIGSLPTRDARLVHMLQLQPKALDAVLFEFLSQGETLRQVRAVRSLGSVPLIVLTGAQKPGVHLADEADVEKLDRFMHQRVYGSQAQLARLSKRGRQIILAHVGHGIPVVDPQSIVEAMRDVLRQVNSNAGYEQLVLRHTRSYAADLGTKSDLQPK